MHPAQGVIAIIAGNLNVLDSKTIAACMDAQQYIYLSLPSIEAAKLDSEYARTHL